MLGLFIDTVSSRNQIFLFEKEKVLAKQNWLAKQNEAEKVLTAIQALLQKSKKTFNQLSLVVVVTGPGRFTSTRIGILVANTLITLLHIPAVGIDRLHLLAWEKYLNASPTQRKKLFPLRITIPSERGDFFTAVYRKLPSVSPITLTVTAPKTSTAALETVSPATIFAFLSTQKKPSYSTVEPVYVREANITARKKR